MEKAAESLPINKLVAKRWSPRSFQNKPIPEEDLRALFEAARWAPSSFNEQPWRFIVTLNGTPAFDKLLATLAKPNQKWVSDAPVLGVSIAKKTFSHNGKPNAHCKHDVGLAMGNLLVEATSRDIYVHQMAGFSNKGVVEKFELPDDYEPVAAFAIGYKGDPSNLDEDQQKSEEAPQERKEQSEFVFFGEWEKPE